MELSIFSIMAPAFVECLILVGIHSYLGLHVLRRKVIFVDLALAQIAALGTTVGFLFGILPGSSGAYWFSLIFAILGAAIFSIAKFKNEKIPQEAIIGTAYAIAAAISILVIDKAPHGAEHIKELLTGSILWVKWETIGEAALAYSIVGIFHFIFRKKFILLSENPQKAESEGLSVKFWDFLFYVSFGIVITHSVGTAGVLLVFVFLVVPAITSMMITDILWKQLVIGWGMGLFVSMSGLYLSYTQDLPSGPTIVAFYGFVLIIVGLIFYLLRASDKIVAIGKLVLGIISILAISFFISFLGKHFHNSEHDHDHDIHQTSSELIEESKPTNSAAEFELLNNKYNSEEDDFSKIEIALKIYKLNKKSGAEKLFKIVTNSNLPFVAQSAYEELTKLSEISFGYDVDKSKELNQSAIRKIKTWIESL